jgi:hypothetical protein
MILGVGSKRSVSMIHNVVESFLIILHSINFNLDFLERTHVSVRIKFLLSFWEAYTYDSSSGPRLKYCFINPTGSNHINFCSLFDFLKFPLAFIFRLGSLLIGVHFGVKQKDLFTNEVRNDMFVEFFFPVEQIRGHKKQVLIQWIIG